MRDMELLTVQETAELLKVAPVTVRRYIASAQLAAVRVGRGMRVPKGEVEDFAKPPESGRQQGNRPNRRRPPGVLTWEDPLWNIVGIASGDGPTDVSSNKHKYLADALYAEFDPEARKGGKPA
jgi:excisionase family DNA binding protein